MHTYLNNKGKGIMIQSVNKNLDLCKKASELLKMIYKLDSSLMGVTYLNSAIKAMLPYINFFFLGSIIDALIDENWKVGMLLVATMLILIVGVKIAISFTDNCIERKRQLLYTSYKCNMHIHFLELDYNVAEKTETKEKLSRASSLIDMYGGLEELVFVVGKIVEAIISICIALYFIIYMVFILFCSGNISSVEKMILTGAILFAIFLYFFTVLKKTNKYVSISKTIVNHHGYNERVLNYFVDQVYLDTDMMYDIKTYDMENLVQKKFDGFLRRSAKNYEEERSNNISFYSTVGVADIIYKILLFVILIRQVLCQIFSTGMFTRYYNYFLNLSGTILSFITEWGNLDRLCTRMQVYKEFMKIEGSPLKEPTTILENIREIVFHDVSYKYPGANNYAVKNINCTFKVGNNMAIVGKNGAGKSTIIKLLCGLYEPTTGYITVDGIDLKNIKEELQMKLGTVFQECVTFPFTVAENIACDTEYDDNQVSKCLEKVGLKEKIMSFSQKLQTNLMNLDSDGVGFSGGERQKLVIARAMYRNNFCYVLDEPASALDVISENELYEAFSKLTKGRLGILVSHRMSGCTLCDSIVVMEDGEINQIGRHSNLLKNCDLYQKLWNAQAKYYLD